MGPGQGPPKVIATRRSDLWDVFGFFYGTFILRDVGPESRVPKNFVGEVAERRGAVEAPGDFGTYFEWPGPVPGTHTGTGWPYLDFPDMLRTFPVATCFRFMSRIRRPEPGQRIAGN